MSASMTNDNDSISEQERLLRGKVLELERVIRAKDKMLVVQEQQIRAMAKAAGRGVTAANMSFNEIKKNLTRRFTMH